MSLFGSSNGKGDSNSKGAIKGSCKSKGCGAKVSGRSGKEANAAAMKHAGNAHGDKFLGFRWGGK